MSDTRLSETGSVRQALRRSRDLVATLDLAAVLVCDAAGRIVFWSEGCVTMFGWAKAEALGGVAVELLRTAPSVPEEEIAAAIARDGEWSGDVCYTRRDGTEITVVTRRVVRRNKPGRVVATMESFADVTALRRAQFELELMNQTLEALVRVEVAQREAAQYRAANAERMQALGQLAGGIAHDLNNVLQAVTSGASLIDRDPGNPERVRRMSRLIADAAARGAGVTGRLLLFSRKADLRAEPIDPRGLLNDLAEVLEHTLGGNVRCEIAALDGLPHLFADRGQLETALVNLATNARDAMPAGGTIVLSAAAEVVTDPVSHPGSIGEGRYVRLSVSDTGTGMDRATLDRITEPFFTTKREGRGTGLGLAMVSGFAAQSGGALVVESEIGKGTVVSLWLPEAVSSGAVRDADPSGAAHSAGAVRILLVDDDAMVREPMAQELDDRGYAVRTAENGAEALALLDIPGADTGCPIDILICDLSMPGMGGIEVIREAQRRWPSLPAILTTGYVGGVAALPTHGAAFAVLRKPVRLDELDDVMTVLLTSADNGGKRGNL